MLPATVFYHRLNTIKIVARRYPRIVVTTTSDPIVRSFSGGSEEDFPPSKVNRRRRRNTIPCHQSLLLWYEPIRRSTFPGQCSQADGSTERQVQTRSIAPLGSPELPQTRPPPG
ncbi:hypothetical protein Bbelb_119920 [Branchiostoma belcheri]|nr:hypothetical protein Bbelb_119920 [Branchiostoma belcheri]